VTRMPVRRLALRVAGGLVIGALATGLRAEPVVTAISPRTFLPGQRAAIALIGQELAEGVGGVAVGWAAPLHVGSIPIEKAEATEAVGVIEPPAGYVGPAWIWPVTASGPAEAPLAAFVDDLPAAAEAAGNASRETAQEIVLPVCIDGTIAERQADYYRFEASAGQRVAVEVLTRQIGSSMDPVVRLLDAEGRVLATVDDSAGGAECRFSHAFAVGGAYLLEVRHSAHVNAAAYHLRVGDFPIVSHAMPLAVQRGTRAMVAFGGVDGPAVPPGELSASAAGGERGLVVSGRLPGGRSSAWARVLVEDAPQVAERAVTGPLELPVGVSGRLDKPGERDVYRLAGAKGAQVRIASRARSLGCATAPRMRLLDAAGKLVAETAVSESDEPEFVATLPADGQYALEIDDLARRGGVDFGYHVAVELAAGAAVALKPDSGVRDVFAVEPAQGCAAIDVAVTRKGYDGELAVSLADPAAGLRIVNPVIPEKANEARIYLAADATWGERSLALVRLVARAGATGPRVPVTTAALRRAKQPWIAFPPPAADGIVFLAGVRGGSPRFELAPASPVELSRSADTHAIVLSVKRLDPNFTGPVTIGGQLLPAGFSVASTCKEDVCEITLSGRALPGSEPTTFRLLAASEIGVRQAVVEIELPVTWTDAASAAAAPAAVAADALPDASAAPAVADGLEPTGPRHGALRVHPPQVLLDGSKDRQRIAVTTVDDAGFSRDWTGAARLRLAAEGVAVVRGTTLFPAGDGATELVVEAGGMRQVVPVVVRNVAVVRPTQFENELMAVLSKQTCSSGACHGSPGGKGGFRLSLRAFDSAFDELTLLREEFGRRVNPLDPDASLLLRKPLMKTLHGGGKQLSRDDEAYAVIRTWIAEGARPDPPNTPRCVRLEVSPAGRQVQRLGEGGRQLLATAHYADGSRRDVSHLVAFESSSVAVASVDPQGRVAPRARGETVILVRYLEHIELAPLLFIEDVPGFAWEDPPENNYVDRLVNEKLRELRYPPSGLCTDAEFVRRVHLDVVGLLPTAAETQAFLADGAPDKRAKLIDRLLERDEYSRFWALKWGDLLRMTQKLAGDEGVFKYHRWLEDSFRCNKPHDQFVRELLLAAGSSYGNPPANFYRTTADMNETVETVSQLFLGVRLQCAKCHNHPFDRWSQDNYYGLGAFFDRVRKQGTLVPGESFIFVASSGETKQPRTGRTMKPWLPQAGEIDAAPDADRREAFADWLLAPGNPYFARVEANRIWSQFFARGIVHPVDDFRDSNPASNRPLLDALAREFAESGFDRKRLMRTILGSRTYQASSSASPLNKEDGLYFSHQLPRLLTAEQLLDAIAQVTGIEHEFANLPAGTRATQLPAPDVAPTDFLKTFGQPARGAACSCERTDDSNLGMAIELFNGKLVHDRLVDANNRFRRALAVGRPPEETIAELYLAAFSRPPSAEELAAAIERTNAAHDPATAIEDVCWALLNSDEFVFQH